MKKDYEIVGTFPVTKNIPAKTVEVWSADWTYLVTGILAVVLVAIMECLVAQNFVIYNKTTATVLSVIMQLPVVLLLMTIPTMRMYKHKEKFTMYFSENTHNIDTLKKRYHLCMADQYGVLFVEKKDRQLFEDWEHTHKYKCTRDIEAEVFDAECSVK